MRFAPQAGESEIECTGHGLKARVTNKLARLAALVALLLLTTGCFSNPNKLTFRSNQTNEVYSQTFKHAYFTRTEDGQYDVVLMQDGITPAGKKSGKALVSAPTGSLNQTVQIRVLWKPLRMTRPDAPSATNSVIHWYVQSSDPGADRLHYRGAGLISVTETRRGAKFMIRNAQVALSEGAGRLHDPLGESSLSGSFEAVRNDQAVVQTIQQLHRDNARVHGSQASMQEGPPARPPAP